jgi:hypothetical protein
MTTHVAIATTQGPVFIQEITQEEPDVSPIVCLNGTSKQLAISTAYADFVKKGSGLIERDFGSASWRMDLSGAIDAGESWQLGVYMAHLLHQGNRLGNGEISDGDEVMLVTGAVKYSGEVTPANQIPEKMLAASAQTEAWQSQGASITLLMHPENLAAAVSTSIVIYEQKAISHIHELTGGKIISRSRSYAMPAILLIALIVIAGFLVLIPELDKEELPDEPQKKEPRTSRVTAAILETLIAAEPFLCQTNKMRKVVQTSGPMGYFKTTGLAELCGINLLAITSDKKHASLYALDSGAMMTLLPATGSPQAGWQIPLPVNNDNPRSYVIIVTSEKLLSKDQAQLNSNLDRLRPFGTNPIEEVLSILNNMNLDADVFGHTLR